MRLLDADDDAVANVPFEDGSGDFLSRPPWSGVGPRHVRRATTPHVAGRHDLHLQQNCYGA